MDYALCTYVSIFYRSIYTDINVDMATAAHHDQ